MKRIFRNLGFLCLIVATMMASRVTTSSAPERPTIDPTCVSHCTGLLFECLSTGAKHNCLSVYRGCIAHCKHD